MKVGHDGQAGCPTSTHLSVTLIDSQSNLRIENSAKPKPRHTKPLDILQLVDFVSVIYFWLIVLIMFSQNFARLKRCRCCQPPRNNDALPFAKKVR